MVGYFIVTQQELLRRWVHTFFLNSHSHPSSSSGVANANGPSPSQQEASIIQSFNCHRKHLSQFIALVVLILIYSINSECLRKTTTREPVTKNYEKLRKFMLNFLKHFDWLFTAFQPIGALKAGIVEICLGLQDQVLVQLVQWLQ